MMTLLRSRGFTNRARMVWAAICALAGLHLIVFDLMVLSARDMIQVMYTPDDGYYYLALARNFIHFGQWTFDGGNSLTSGFHLLLAYLLAGLYDLLRPDSAGFVLAGLGMGAVVSIATVWLAWRVSWREQDAFPFIALTILITAKSFLLNSVSITEWPLIVLIAGLYFLTLYARETGRPHPTALFLLGIFGSLARSDFGLLPLSGLAAALIVERAHHVKPYTRAALAGLAGASLGVGLITLHNLATTGTLVQSSALMKSHWAQFGSQNVYSTLALVLNVFGMDLGFADFNRSVFLLGVLLLSGPLLLIALIKQSGQNNLPLPDLRLSAQQSTPERILVLTALLCLAGYGGFYAYNGAIQNWYTANLIWPAFVVLVAGARYIHARFMKEAHFAVLWLSLFAVTAFLTLLPNLYPLSEQTAPWPHHRTLLEASQYLKNHPVNGKVGAWNAGILGYALDGTTIINIDGLVNNDIYPYAISNRLPAYLDERDIRYILDFENMFAPSFAARGGYADPSFLARLQPIKTFDEGQFTEFKFLRLYEIRP